MQHSKKSAKRLSCWNECFSLLLCYFKHYIECLLWIENVSWGNIMKSFSTIWAVIWNWEKSIKNSWKKMATSFFGKFTPSRTQCNQRPKINIQNIREYIGPSTIRDTTWPAAQKNNSPIIIILINSWALCLGLSVQTFSNAVSTLSLLNIHIHLGVARSFAVGVKVWRIKEECFGMGLNPSPEKFLKSSFVWKWYILVDWHIMHVAAGRRALKLCIFVWYSSLG